MRLAILAGSVSRQAGGVFDAVRRPASLLSTRYGLDIKVLGTHDSHTDADQFGWAPLKPEAFVVKGPRGFGLAPGMAVALERFHPDLHHSHGLWMYNSLVSYRFHRYSRTPYVISPHGMLDPWAVKRSAWKKRMVAWIFEHKHLTEAGCLHALCVPEQHAIRAFGLRNPICVVPNGIDLPQRQGLPAPWRSQVDVGQKVLLYLGRLHPKKGLRILLSAWEQVALGANLQSEWVLAIAGWNQGGHEQELKQAASELRLGQSVIFLGPQFDGAKDACYENADAFVLPSFSEGLPMTVLEAWANELPVLMTPQCNIPQGFALDAAVRSDPTPESLAEGLRNILGMSASERRAMGQRGLRLVERQFTVARVAADMLEVYKWLLGGGAPPECVKF